MTSPSDKSGKKNSIITQHVEYDSTAPTPSTVLEQTTWKSKQRHTVLAVACSTIGAFCLGNVLSWSAISLADPQFKEKFLGIGDGSWVASLALFGAMCSAPVAGLLIAKIGRRRKILFTSIPLAIGWALISFAPHVAVLYLGRFLTGFCAGAFTVSVPTYISEVSEDKVRGRLGSTFIIMGYSGSLFTLVLGAFVNWFVLSLVSGTIPILLFVVMLFMPESPRYLVSTGKVDEAQSALKWLRGANSVDQVQPEVATLQKSVAEAELTASQSPKLSDLFVLRVLKPVGICIVIFWVVQFSGMNAINLYTVKIFRDAGSDMDEYLASVLLGATQALAVAVVPILLVEKWGRRNLLILSGGSMSLCFLVLGGYSYLRGNGILEEGWGWLPVAALILTTIGYSAGLGPVPWVVTSEILPNDVKELASSIISISYWGFSFLSGKTFPNIASGLGYTGVYWLSSGICLAGAIFVASFVPETKGKSSEEIQGFFTGKEGRTEKEKEANSHINRSLEEGGVDNLGFGNNNGTPKLN